MLDVITKKIMEQFKFIQNAGSCNMLDHECVIRFADMMDFHELAVLSSKEYIDILGNYEEYTKKFGV